MNPVQNFKQLEAWQLARLICLEVYTVTKQFPLAERYGLVSQLQRASSSIMANIAEGFERYYPKDKVRFYYQARGSAGEVESFIILARDLDYVSDEWSELMTAKIIRIGQLINGLIRALMKRKSGPG